MSNLLLKHLEIYEKFLSKAMLSEIDRKILKESRGFTDETINRNRFVSGGKYLLDFDKEFRECFSNEDLLVSGIYVVAQGDGVIKFNPMLLEPRIIIPYLNNAGRPYHLRPHKLGFEGIGIEIYQDLNLIGPELILTEGEFKAAAAIQLGFSAIAVPGISSFSGQHLPKLVELLKNNNIKDVAVIFDNEQKDAPRLSKYYKSDPSQRYDTIYYAFLMAKLLTKEGFNTRVCWLPDEWRVKGKADIDGALAQGKTKGDFDQVIAAGKIYKDFFGSLSKEAKKIIKRKEKQRYFRSHIHEDLGRYVAQRTRGKTEWDEIISNFTLRLINAVKTREGIYRDVQFIDEFGEESPILSLSPEDMMGEGFRTFCYAHGNFVWRGDRNDLDTIWEMEFLNNNRRLIVEPDHVGWLPEDKIWIFDNMAIDGWGQEIESDENKVVWLPNRGIKPISLCVTTGKDPIQEGIPKLNPVSFDILEIKNRLSETIGDFEANVCLGWISAIPFMEEAYQKDDIFPFLFLEGKRGSGKSTVAKWLMRLCGIEHDGLMASDTTPVAIQRFLSYYSSLPIFMDEYRNGKNVVSKNGLLRSAYNRQSAGKGIKADFGVREGRIRGTLLIAGEETPEDSALKDRCVVVQILKSKRKNNHIGWFTNHKNKFSFHLYNIIIKKKTLLPIFERIMQEARDFFYTKKLNDRLVIHYSIVVAGYAASFGEDKTFADQLAEKLPDINMENDEEHPVARFISHLLSLVISGGHESDEIKHHIEFDEAEKQIYLHFPGLYLIWSRDYQRVKGDVPFKDSAIRQYLYEEKGYIASSKDKRIKGSAPLKCIVFDYESASDSMKRLADNIAATATRGAT